ncbi:hypothetical protein ES703_123299 [subsurface metagenome]
MVQEVSDAPLVLGVRYPVLCDVDGAPVPVVGPVEDVPEAGGVDIPVGVGALPVAGAQRVVEPRVSPLQCVFHQPPGVVVDAYEVAATDHVGSLLPGLDDAV